MIPVRCLNVANTDKTDYLRMGGYWPSYNVPFYKSIYEVSGNKVRIRKNNVIN